MTTTATPRRVKVTGDRFHGHVPDGAVYVGRAAPGLRASKYANPFALTKQFPRDHPLRRFLDAAVDEVAAIDTTVGRKGEPHYDVITPATRAVATTAYRHYLASRPDLTAAARAELVGRDLACWCDLPDGDGPDYCHCAVLLEVANSRGR